MKSTAINDDKPRVALPREVILLGWVSFFADISSEMVYPLLPMFVVGVLGAPALALGLIEGAAEGLVSVLKAVAGWRSDRSGRRVPFVRIGYALPVIGKGVLALATVWPMAFAGRMIDRFGKGIRSSPRDAIIADVALPGQRGRAFGLHRTMDTMGAVVGVLAASALVWWLGSRSGESDSRMYRTTFAIAAALGLASVAVTLFVREPQRKSTKQEVGGKTTSPTPMSDQVAGVGLFKFSARFWLTLGVLMIFAIANSSDAFILLRAGQLGMPPWAVVLAYAAYNFTYSALSYPAGALSDRIGRWPVIVIGWMIYAAVYAGFALSGMATIWPLLAMYGVYMAMTEGVGKALIADHAPPERRATAIGIFNMLLGFATLSSSVIAGVLWDRVSPVAPFWFGSIVAVIAVISAIVLRSTLSRSGIVGHAGK